MEPSNQIPDDQVELALRLLDDDETALANVLQQFGPPVAKCLRTKYNIFTYEDVEDVLAIAIRRLWDARQGYNENVGPLRSYFWAIADNVARDIFKYGWHRARQMEVTYGKENNLDEIIVDPDSIDDSSSLSSVKKHKSSAKAEKERKDFKEIIEQLSKAQRHIILADAYARDGVADAGVLADELGIGATSVRVYRMRAMNTIRRKMRERGHDVP